MHLFIKYSLWTINLSTKVNSIQDIKKSLNYLKGILRFGILSKSRSFEYI